MSMDRIKTAQRELRSLQTDLMVPTLNPLHGVALAHITLALTHVAAVELQLASAIAHLATEEKHESERAI